MSEVSLLIGGRSWRVACAPGEEDRVKRLGATVAEKLEAMGATGAADAQNMLFAALLLADEVHEGRDAVAAATDRIDADPGKVDAASNHYESHDARVAELEAELDRLRTAGQAAADDLEKARAEQADLRAAIAERASDVAGLRERVAALQDECEALRTVPPSPPEAHSIVDDAAPALERFAEMLELCADKLEARAKAS